MYRKAAILGSSDGRKKSEISRVLALSRLLKEEYHMETEYFPTIFCNESGETINPKMRAESLIDAFQNPSYDIIIDVTGGDSANGILPYLDGERLCHIERPYFGYSDVSVVLNVLRSYEIPVFYFQALYASESHVARDSFSAVLSGEKNLLKREDCRFLQGDSLSGQIVGGNIRCTLKLFGTKFQPDFHGKVLFLESNSGGREKIESMLWQYKMSGSFDACHGILLGNFSGLSEKNDMEWLYTRVCEIIDRPELPIVATMVVGHQADSICLPYAHVDLS